MDVVVPTTIALLAGLEESLRSDAEGFRSSRIKLVFSVEEVAEVVETGFALLRYNDGLPFGMQLVGRRFADRGLLALADAFERATDGAFVRRAA